MIGGTAPARAASGTCSVTAGCGRPAAVKAASIRSRRHLRANSGRNSARSAHQAVRCSSAQPGAYGLDSPEHSFAAAPAALRCRRKRRPGAAQAQTRGKGGAVLEPATRLPVDRQHGHGQARHACISALNADVSPASEMLAAGPLNEGHVRTRGMAHFFPGESPRLVQLYGVDPAQVRQAAAWLAQQAGAQHIDLNFGCPIRKVTAKGGGAAVPARPRLLAQLVAAAVAGAGGAAAVTFKFRIGISNAVPTFLEAGRVSEAEGAAALSLQARTAAQLYVPPAEWSAIARLVAAVSIPVLGNSDVLEVQWAPADDYDPREPFAAALLRHARLKGAVQANRQKVSLPPGWLGDQQLDKKPLLGAGVSCEG